MSIGNEISGDENCEKVYGVRGGQMQMLRRWEMGGGRCGWLVGR
jgi:hypothetical protein